MKLFKPLQLGSLQLEQNLVQAPLAGVSFAPFRRLIWEYSSPGFCATPMISALDLTKRHDKINLLTHRYDDEGPLCYQLSGNQPDVLGEAARIVTDLGADLIDLNCGCPMRKIRNKGCGSQLLRTPAKLETLISAMKQNTTVPVSIKVRVGEDSKGIITAAENGGADFIIVHGRHWTERYDVPCRYDDIKSIVDMTKLPVIGNGDVADLPSLQKLIEKTGCAGAMVARASVGKPWLFNQLKNPAFKNPNSRIIGNLFYRHISMLAELVSEKIALLHARRLVKYYAKSTNVTHSPFEEIHCCVSLEQLENVIHHYF